MATDLIRYDLLVQDALRGVVRRVLDDTMRDGLPGEHHYYITFKTHQAGVRLSDRMRERYPDEMTIILQHQFWDLAVTDHSFEVGLSFSGIPERLLIPFDALTGFFDPSAQFGIKFEVQEPANEANANDSVEPAAIAQKAGKIGALPKPVADKDAKPAKELKTQPAAAEPATGGTSPREKIEKITRIEKIEKITRTTPATEAAKPDADQSGGTKIISIDAFRKKT